MRANTYEFALGLLKWRGTDDDFLFDLKINI